MSLDTFDLVMCALAYPVAGGILLNQLDELFIDLNYLLRGLHRRKKRVISWQALENVEQQRIAIIVPAWREAEVIRSMLEHNVASFDYDPDRYTIFCGTYQNDPDTQREVDAACRRFSNVRKVVVPHDGPTSKADCLNWVYQGIVLDERDKGIRYDILLMHDAEDVIHPLSLRLYSLLIPEHDFVQTPVFSLELGLRQAVAATYIDEFAEHHLKDMLVREALGGLVPSAGVGSAFSRDAFEEIARKHGERPFNVESLTEDYEIGLKFRLAGKRVHFACRSLVRPGSEDGSKPGEEEMIATREYFPDGFKASVRQRSRWILGITLQTWAQIGWKGPPAVLYCLWRDRKALFTNMLLCLAYLLVAYGAVRTGMKFLGYGAPFSGLAPAGAKVLGTIMLINLVTMLWRMGMKARLVGRLYGRGHAILSVPRLVLGNLISLAATGKAVYSYIRHRITGAPLRWLKTTHAFPNADILRAARRRLGEILTEQQGLRPAELDEALQLQQEVGRPLGEVLSTLGMVSAQDVTRALAQLHDLMSVELDAKAPAARVLAVLPEEVAERLGVCPLGPGAGKSTRVAAEGPLLPDALRALERYCGGPVEVVLAPPEQLREARKRAYRQLLGADDHAPNEGVGDGSPVLPGELDEQAFRALGAGFCATYAVVPMRTPLGLAEGARRIATAFPLHPAVGARIVERLRGPVEVVRVSPLAIDVALALQEQEAPEGQRTVDVLEAIAGLENSGALEPTAAARARAVLLGLPTVEPQPGMLDWPLLPPELRGPNEIHVRGLGRHSLILDTARPSPRLARAVAALYPGWAIAWEVALPQPVLAEGEDTPWTRSIFQAMTN